MLSPVKQLSRISVIFHRAYCFVKTPPPGSNPNKARQTPWSPYNQILRDDKSDFIEDPMEFRTDNDEPFLRRKGKSRYYMEFIKNFSQKWTRGFTFTQKLRNRVRYELIEDQLYNSERVKTLGPDLAAAHFFCARGGGVKFVGKDGFVQPGVNRAHLVLPPLRDDSFKVEAINAVNYNLIYEGLLLLKELESLRWISFKGNTVFDNWCMDRLSLVVPNLEFINLSGCIQIDHNAFACFYRFKKLRCVCVEDTNQTDLFKLACLTLESEYPNLVFVGLELQRPKKSVFNNET